MTEVDVFEAVRRGYSELNDASPQEIIRYFDLVDEEEVAGHISNIKGIAFEQIVVGALNESGVDARLFDELNHPLSDIAIFDESDLIDEFQLKATDDVSYITSTLDANPDIPIITTSEVASSFQDYDSGIVLNSGVSNEDLTEAVESALFCADSSSTSDAVIDGAVDDGLADSVLETVADIGFPFSPFWFLGLPF